LKKRYQTSTLERKLIVGHFKLYVSGPKTAEGCFLVSRYQTSTPERKLIVGHFRRERLGVKNQFLWKYKKSEKILTLEMKPRARCGIALAGDSPLWEDKKFSF